MNLHFKTFRTKHVPDDWEGNDYGTEDKHTSTQTNRGHTHNIHTRTYSRKNTAQTQIRLILTRTHRKQHKQTVLGHAQTANTTHKHTAYPEGGDLWT